MLFPIMGFVLVAYLVIGLAMPVLPLYVHSRLGGDSFVVGIVAGAPFAAAFPSRIAAGRFTDGRGAKQSVIAGLLVASAGGLLYVVSVLAVALPNVAIAILAGGRALLGVADSFIITGALSWALASMGTQSTGKVMAWVGTSLYAAFAIGAPAGSASYAARGFTAIALATTLVPAAAIALVAPLRSPPRSPPAPPAPIANVARAVALPGVGIALGGVGFGAILAFIALLFAEHRWAPVWLAFSAMSVAFIVGRLGLGWLPDKIGGAKVTFFCVIVEAIGLMLVWAAPAMDVALGGIALASLGYALVYPSLGVEAVRRAPPQSRGLAMGAYSAFLDLSLGLSSPILGLIATRAGLNDVFAVSAVVVLSSAAVALRLWRPSSKGSARLHAKKFRRVDHFAGAVDDRATPHDRRLR
jgi:MFS family permease